MHWEVLADTDLRMAFPPPNILLWSGAKLQIQKHTVNSSEWRIHCSLVPRTNPNLVLGSKTGLWCCGLQMHRGCLWPFHLWCTEKFLFWCEIQSHFPSIGWGLGPRGAACPQPIWGNGSGAAGKSSTFSCSTSGLCDPGEVTSPFWVCCLHWVVV